MDDALKRRSKVPTNVKGDQPPKKLVELKSTEDGSRSIRNK